MNTFLLTLFLTLSPVSREKTVFICYSRSAYAYHADSLCHGLQRCTHQIFRISRRQAEQKRYQPCKICFREAER
ncbi:hypothetical protein SAMN04488090_2879 [Siphonobacter aquaeclarae]|uniref:Metal binding domain of Ada n=1 Tax=Siphonobacter aquaeclarae TaxID=563176 RepID=A0A1G9RFQ4_9BACT|nr:hypothetical protein SAMN04488090_2879 [Siphonobacter aquaeclarae]